MEKKKMVICEKSEGYKYQGPRFKHLGPYSGEEFRNTYLLPWLDDLGEQEEAIIDFKGTVVYSPSFLEESFGGAIRAKKENKEKISHLAFVNITSPWDEKLKEYIKNAKYTSKK
jgi:hypothetical protein